MTGKMRFIESNIFDCDDFFAYFKRSDFVHQKKRVAVWQRFKNFINADSCYIFSHGFRYVWIDKGGCGVAWMLEAGEAIF